MENFLASVERRAFIMAKIATSSEDEALDIVQDAMLALVKRYGNKPKKEWSALFFRILQNKIRDWYRRTAIRNKVRFWFGGWQKDHDIEEDVIANVADPKPDDPATNAETNRSITVLESALRGLPLRQQQAFMLRAWEGFNVKETANAMNCSTGSVKTHYSRAIHTLRSQLEGT